MTTIYELDKSIELLLNEITEFKIQFESLHECETYQQTRNTKKQFKYKQKKNQMIQMKRNYKRKKQNMIN